MCCVLEGWILVAFGTYTSHYDRKQYANQYAKQFVPCAYMFVRTEHELGYTTLFQTVHKYAKKFFDIDLKFRYGALPTRKTS